MNGRDELTGPTALGSALQLMGVERVAVSCGGAGGGGVGGGVAAAAVSALNGDAPAHDEPPRKRPRVHDDATALRRRILDCQLVRLRTLRENITEQLSELYYLQAGGNMMDYATWRKRPPAPQLVAFLEARRPPAVSAPPLSPPPPPAAPVPAVAAPSPADEMVEKAKQEAYVASRVAELARAGLWAERRLPRVLEPPRPKSHWDYLLEEMAWLAQDFAHERKWKKQAAKKCARAVQKYFQDKAVAAQKAEKAQELQLRKIAAFAAKEIRTFWSNVEKLVEWKRSRVVERARKVALDEQLSYIVDKTERYSRQLAANMRPLPPPPAADQATMNIDQQSDDEFEPRDDSDDDEETIAAAERDATHEPGEIEALRRESRLDLGDLLPPGYLAASPPPSDYSAGDDDSADDETTIAAQESREREHDTAAELAALRSDAELAIDELRKRYAEPPLAGRDEDTDTSQTETESDTESESSVCSEPLERLVLDVNTNEGSERRVEAAASLAATLQPTGTTLSETTVGTPVPSLLRHKLREYQHVGLHWLATMYMRKLNGILADEMGLGKTVQTIALLAHLAVERHDWGPHLVVAPTSVVLNWEMEFKKWCPAFKILTYYGTIKERKLKRVGWTKANSFHVCITSYKLVVQDHQSFRRKRWKYLILDEAQNIKNFKSQRWQMLLNFQTERRLLLTGTPLQNSLLELWSLMHFLMPDVFASHSEFREWFSEVAGIADGSSRYNEGLVRRLHEVLRPFLLRRLKVDVERQMPRKYEHVLMCRLAKRQRYLYDDFMARANTRECLASGNLLSVINVLMQLRKVCNHPDLFEPRPVSSPLHMSSILYTVPALVLVYDVYERVECAARIGGDLATLEASDAGAFVAHRARHLAPPRRLVEELAERSDRVATSPRPPPASIRVHMRLVPRATPRTPPPTTPHAPPPQVTLTTTTTTTAQRACTNNKNKKKTPTTVTSHTSQSRARLEHRRRACMRRVAIVNERRCWRLPLYGHDLRTTVQTGGPPVPHRDINDILLHMKDIIDRFCVCWVSARAGAAQLVCGAGRGAREWRRLAERAATVATPHARRALALLHAPAAKHAVAFPHPSLLQYDCGKLQTLDGLLRRLKAGGHRVLIFTQMTRVLDVLEAFLSLHGHAYLRLDGATRVDRRQALVDRFNADPRIFAFILSTRSGGVGLNLTGADSVVFYDSDWNPTMDAQAQDRCHRIGQTRDVHVYRLVTAATVEENILRKAEQKRGLGHIAIEGGHFTTSYLRGADVHELLGATPAAAAPAAELESALAAAEDEADAAAARAARAEAQGELAEFDESLPLDDETRAQDAQPRDELAALMSQLSPVEQYAMRIVECSEACGEAERAALESVRRQVNEWERARRRERDAASTPPPPPSAPPTPPPHDELTYTREAAHAQVWVNTNGPLERMPMWCPPTPPSGDGDVYCDVWARLLYRPGAATEASLPPASLCSNTSGVGATTTGTSRRDASRAQRRLSRPQPQQQRHHHHAPLTMFERAGVRRSGGVAGVRVRQQQVTTSHAHHTQHATPEWSAPEDATLRRALRLQRIPNEPPPALTVNWEWTAELVADVARAYRSPRACRDRHDALADPERARRRHRRPPAARRRHDDDAPRPPLAKLDALRDATERRRATHKRRHDEPQQHNNKQHALLAELGVQYDVPPTPMDVATRRAERIAKEKLKASAAPPAAPAAAPPAAPAAAPQRVVVAARAAAPSAGPAPVLYRHQTFPARHLKILHQGAASHAQVTAGDVAPALRKLHVQQVSVRRAAPPAAAAVAPPAPAGAGPAAPPGAGPAPRVLAAGAHVLVAHVTPRTQQHTDQRQ